MSGQYVTVDVSDLRAFNDKLRKAAGGDFKKELINFLDGVGFEMLRIIEDEIIRLEAVDTRQLLNSFHKGDKNNIYELDEGDLKLTIGTNVEYAAFVNDGHWANPQGIESRFVPGYWTSDGKFRYQKGASTGMVLKQQYIEGKHYIEHSVDIMEKMFPRLVEAKLKQWLNNCFS